MKDDSKSDTNNDLLKEKVAKKIDNFNKETNKLEYNLIGEKYRRGIILIFLIFIFIMPFLFLLINYTSFSIEKNNILIIIFVFIIMMINKSKYNQLDKKIESEKIYSIINIEINKEKELCFYDIEKELNTYLNSNKISNEKINLLKKEVYDEEIEELENQIEIEKKNLDELIKQNIINKNVVKFEKQKKENKLFLKKSIVAISLAFIIYGSSNFILKGINKIINLVLPTTFSIGIGAYNIKKIISENKVYKKLIKKTKNKSIKKQDINLLKQNIISKRKKLIQKIIFKNKTKSFQNSIKVKNKSKIFTNSEIYDIYKKDNQKKLILKKS